MDQLKDMQKHLESLTKELPKLAGMIEIPNGATQEQKDLINQAKNAVDFSGDLKQKQSQLNTLLNAITNYR